MTEPDKPLFSDPGEIEALRAIGARVENGRVVIVREERSRWYESIDWSGVCALVLALGISLGLLVGFLRWLSQPSSLSDQGQALLSTLGGAIVGAVATYMGTTQAFRDRRTTTIKPADAARPPDPPDPPVPPRPALYDQEADVDEDPTQ